MVSIINKIDYALLGVGLCLLAALAFPLVAKKTTDFLHTALIPLAGIVLYAFVRWQWSIFSQGSFTINADTPCEMKNSYYLTQRNTYLDGCVVLCYVCVMWVASLKKQIMEREKAQ
eukprot:gnl/TRDRNA2_/TRDRNA2_186306_c0_seq1.p1 gnl/TRDRNA2_/TRDRNA2_186306_c0~~gnl/TRDRNA2_/TRDRNA2_186306_c0_seq1.p1  ORF type:complete len:116 (+),score=15.31 gnl/TRDRNA2_/TRDRNA2_186306_c0_seq1:64-411(+)